MFLDEGYSYFSYSTIEDAKFFCSTARNVDDSTFHIGPPVSDNYHYRVIGIVLSGNLENTAYRKCWVRTGKVIRIIALAICHPETCKSIVVETSQTHFLARGRKG